ncbi:MAG: hypothetical protein KatS3mg103_0686 [Phycisphaerales bacterium]|nr:MAG: hypothetical protein KatS3mg103_0686 [Phycisphaerales bacterium]
MSNPGRHRAEPSQPREPAAGRTLRQRVPPRSKRPGVRGGLGSLGSWGGLGVLGLLAAVLAVAAIGAASVAEAVATAVAVAWTWGLAGSLAGAYLAASWGLGGLVMGWFARWCRPAGAPEAPGAATARGAVGTGSAGDARAVDGLSWLSVPVGLGLMLSLSHGLGVLGAFELLGPGGRPIVAGLPILIGLVLLAHQRLVQGRSAGSASLHPAVLAGVPAAAVLVVASACPVGWLWPSEGFGYDTRSYHLQLPAEWLAMGRLWPVEHNVYSFLPGLVESAFYHLLAVLDAHPAQGDGLGLLACQCLGALTALLAAALMARVGLVVLERAGHGGDARRASGAACAVFAVVLGTPWLVVVGSLAYNEPAMLALGAGAMLAALDARIAPAWRWGLSAMLVGLACGAKPTALVLVGPLVGALLLATTPRRALPWGVAVLVLVGLATLLPWMVRNALATGNPLFPQLPGLLGQGHWTAEQHARWASGHVFGGSWLDRLRLVLLPDPSGGFAGTSMRGLAHPQWGVVGVAGLLAGVLTPVMARRSPLAWALAAGMAGQLAGWLALTHLQSRFLLPMLLAFAPALAIVAGRLGRAGLVGLVVLGLVQGGWTLWGYASQRDGRPNLAIVPGVALFTGRLEPAASAAGTINVLLPDAGQVLLVGDAAPLYLLRPVRYATTWDRSILAEVLAAHPGQPDAQARALRALGVRWLLVDRAELQRLDDSGWLDPALTPGAVEALARTGELVGRWPAAGQPVRMLIDLGPVPTPTIGSTEPAR